MMRFALLIVAAMAAPVYGQNCPGGVCKLRPAAAPVVQSLPTANSYGIALAPGEILISVGGIPVAGNPPAGAAPAARPGMLPGEINRNQAAYDFAKRDCYAMIKRGRVGHFIGIAPNCTRAGTGNSVSLRPNHCYLGVPESQIVARACVYANGRYWWSCHLR